MLCAAMHHILQGHLQVVHDLFALQPPLASSQPAVVAVEPTHVAEGEPSEGVKEIIFAVKVRAEEVKLVRALEEGREGGVGVTVEIIAENFALGRH